MFNILSKNNKNVVNTHENEKNIIWFSDCNLLNKNLVGGKCSSLGELKKLSKELNFNIADGFAISTLFYEDFLYLNNLNEKIYEKLVNIENNINDIEYLEVESEKIRSLFLISIIPKHLEDVLKENYQKLSNIYNTENVDVAVRSSAIAEDLENASFAGQQDTYLNIRGFESLKESVLKCFSSLFTSRAISYRYYHKIDYKDVKMSVGIQKMIRSDIGSAGVSFSIDPESGYNKAIVINSAFGLGELVVSGGIKPDEFIIDKRLIKQNLLEDKKNDIILSKKLGEKNNKIIYDLEKGFGTIEINTNLNEKNKYSLNNIQINELSRIVYLLENKYQELYNEKIGIDVEWALDGINNNLYILQTRPETVQSIKKNQENIKYIKYELEDKNNLEILLEGVAVGEKISNGNICYCKSKDDMKKFIPGSILLTEMTTPDWEPIMKISNGIITEKGGRTCHAAIVARELGLNALVGCGNKIEKLINEKDGVTIDCSKGETGYIIRGKKSFQKLEYDIDLKKERKTKMMMNIANPEQSFNASLLPNDGVGLLRMEFIISNHIKYHPLWIYDLNKNELEKEKELKDKIKREELNDAKEWFIKELARGISKIASSFYPNPVILRMSDFKSNEYKILKGGEKYEPNEENPMIGWRGCSRYYDKEYERGFELECKAVKYVREIMNMKNLIVMLPFCRTVEELKKVIEVMKKYDLERGKDDFQLYMMCEIPSNVIESDLFAPYLDGISIGGNDLLQLTLGLDRDREKIQHIGKYENESYRRLIKKAIKDYKDLGVKVGYCGQQPSDSIEFCHFLINENIDSISITSDCVLKTLLNII